LTLYPKSTPDPVRLHVGCVTKTVGAAQVAGESPQR
jgi:hypothetical protein